MFFLYPILLVVICLLENTLKISHKRILLMLLCSILTLYTGLRSIEWPDTYGYMKGFCMYTNSLFHYSITDSPYKYSDKGFYLLSSIIKTFTDNYHSFFLCIACLTFLFLCKSLSKYSIYPLLGLCVYISRFMLSRNMMQIRAALAIAIVIYGLKYIEKRNIRKFLLIICIAATLHLSMVLAIPLYWVNKLKLTFRHISYWLIGAFITTALFSSFIIDKVTQWTLQYDIATTYTNETSGYTIGKGLANPMIYYQVFLLLLFAYHENKLQGKIPYYQTIRNGYFYSTILLILFSSFSALSGRTSTIYATLEIFILPSFLLLFPRRLRMIGYCGIIIVLFSLFYLYSSPLLKYINS